MADSDTLIKALSEPTNSAGRPDLGVGKLAEKLGLEPGKRWGKWCSVCRGLWFGWIFEVECPKCGNRHG